MQEEASQKNWSRREFAKGLAAAAVTATTGSLLVSRVQGDTPWQAADNHKVFDYHPQRELYLHDKLDLPDEVQEKILWENAHELILDA